jgi:hypothetical protein
MKGGEGFGALKSDSTHLFFRNACTKSGSLRANVSLGIYSSIIERKNSYIRVITKLPNSEQSYTEFGAVMTIVLPVLFKYCYEYCYSDSRKL